MNTRNSTPLIVWVSYVVCALCLVAVLPVGIFLPRFVEAYLHNYILASAAHILPVTLLLYVGLLLAAAVLVLLCCLLRVAQKGDIFTPVSGRLVLAVALLVIAEGGVFAGLSAFVLPVAALAVTVVAVVMGLCFMVVSHILCEAAAIKAENDGTI